MAQRKKLDGEADMTREPERTVRVTITKFGDGKVSTGEHVSVKGDVMAKRGEVLETSAEAAAALEAAGLAEISE
jgi:hypothetical protein